MKIYLSGINGVRKWLEGKQLNAADIFALESFWSLADWERSFIPKFRGFILDSGAFSFMNSNSKINQNWNDYVDKYADFITENDIRLFFELDIDCIVGLQEVERLRKRLENRTGRQPIVVWHPGRGKNYWQEMIKEYPYIAIGGIAAKERPLTWYESIFPYMIDMAHKGGRKVHGLGYTIVDKLSRYRFDSIDSTTWMVGSRFGEVSLFKNGLMERITYRKNGVKTKMVKDREALNLYNFKEWLKMSHFADLYL